jgi:hypothetical protein
VIEIESCIWQLADCSDAIAQIESILLLHRQKMSPTLTLG